MFLIVQSVLIMVRILNGVHFDCNVLNYNALKYAFILKCEPFENDLNRLPLVCTSQLFQIDSYFYFLRLYQYRMK